MNQKDYVLCGLSYDRHKASALFRKKGGEIKSSNILTALTPDITCPDWRMEWVFLGGPHGGLPGYMSIFHGYYVFTRGSKSIPLYRWQSTKASLLGAKWSGAKITKSKPLNLP